MKFLVFAYANIDADQLKFPAEKVAVVGNPEDRSFLDEATIMLKVK